MGQISPTLAELLEIPNWTPFWEHNILNYEHLKEMIIQKFYLREIAYDTPDYFRVKLNYVLEVNAPIYNKMLASEYVDINPFVTDYHEETFESTTSGSENYADTSGLNKVKQGGVRSGSSSKAVDNSEGKSNVTNNDAKASVNYNANLFSSAENTFQDEKDQSNKTHDETKTGKKDYTLGKTWNETINYTDDTNQTVDTTSERDIDRNTNSNQTARDWTEKGNSKAHNLDVNSDTPQSMLFNTPNHYMGTGTADDYGIASGNGYTPYLEEDIDRLDVEPRSINGGDTPWFNYASSANNRLGHDNYSRSGTETYARNQTDVTNDDLTKNEELQKTLVHDSDRKGTSNDTFNQNTTDTDNYTEDETINRESVGSTGYDSNEHGSQTYQENLLGNKDSRDARETIKRSANRAHSDTWESEGNQAAKKYNRGTSGNVKNMRKIEGRSFKSPSALLNEYRATLTYSADLYMLDKLEACFLQIF